MLASHVIANAAQSLGDQVRSSPVKDMELSEKYPAYVPIHTLHDWTLKAIWQVESTNKYVGNMAVKK